MNGVAISNRYIYDYDTVILTSSPNQLPTKDDGLDVWT